MGIQNRNSKNKHGENSVNVNINITETTPPNVVKIPTKVVRVPIVKKKKKRAKAPSLPGERDVLSARPVEQLQELANEFSRVKDLAQSRGVPIPPSYSQFSDIRDRASLQSNTELLQERIRQLNKLIAERERSGGAPPPEIADEVAPFVDPVVPLVPPVPPVPQNPNMFDEPAVVELTEEIESNQIIARKCSR